MSQLIGKRIWTPLAFITLLALCPGAAQAQSAPVVSIRLPERFRLLTGQQFDLRVEAAGLTSEQPRIAVALQGPATEALRLPAPEIADDVDSDPASRDRVWTFRTLQFTTPGVKTLKVTISDGDRQTAATERVAVQAFQRKPGTSVILFIGDGMGNAYRDAGRIVAGSTRNRFREGFLDQLQEMDSLPVSGMVMTYASDRVVPDSANTAAAWATGNKTTEGTLSVFPDSDDFRYDSSKIQTTKQYALNNPRVETLWEYLKRRFNYRTGIVTTSDVTDATPAAEGSHSLTRTLQYDIARQMVDGSFTPGPVFDVILGGGRERFLDRTQANSGDERNLAKELQDGQFQFVESRKDLKLLAAGTKLPDKMLGLFRTRAC